MTRSDILERAKSLVNGDRAEQYGGFKEQAEKLATMWSTVTGQDLKPEHVAPILCCLKIVRMTTATDTDSETDLAGYAALHAESFKGARSDFPDSGGVEAWGRIPAKKAEMAAQRRLKPI